MNAQYMTFDGETFSRDTYNLCSTFAQKSEKKARNSKLKG